MSARARGGLRPALLSGLVFPGVGQLANGQPWRALAFGAGSLLLLVVLLHRLWIEILVRLPVEPEALLDPGLPFRLATEVQRANASFFTWATLGLAALWLASIVDAWFAGRSSWPAPRSPGAK